MMVTGAKSERQIRIPTRGFRISKRDCQSGCSPISTIRVLLLGRMEPASASFWLQEFVRVRGNSFCGSEPRCTREGRPDDFSTQGAGYYSKTGLLRMRLCLPDLGLVNVQLPILFPEPYGRAHGQRVLTKGWLARCISDHIGGGRLSFTWK